MKIKTTLFVLSIIFIALWLGLSNCIPTNEPEPCEPDTVKIVYPFSFIYEPELNLQISSVFKNDTNVFKIVLLPEVLKSLADKYYPCKPVHDTTAVHDTLYLPEPQPAFNQIPARTAYTLSWKAEPDSTMGIFLIYNSGPFDLPGYLIKTVNYPDSTCILQSNELSFESQDYLLTKIYMQAKDNAGNLSAPTADSVKAVFARTPGTWGDVTGGKGFDSKDLSIMEYDSKKGYNPAFDFNADGRLDSLDFKLIIK